MKQEINGTVILVS